jgi:hypothetical protein
VGAGLELQVAALVLVQIVGQGPLDVARSPVVPLERLAAVR